jgi:tetratricopeptide (TPR) repeat protein
MKLNQAGALQNAGQPAHAAAIYRDVLRTQPKNFPALFGLGLICAHGNDKHAAAEWFGKAAKAQPANAVAHYCRGLALHESGRADSAVVSFRRAIALKADYAEAHFGLGNALLELNDLDGALACHDAAIALKADYADAYSNRGVVLKNLRRTEDAIASFDHAIALRPNFAQAYCNRGFTLLLAGRLRAGWPDNEWRFALMGGPHARQPAQPPRQPWSAHQLASGRTFLLRCEQGLGDTLQFCRYAARIAAAGGTVILEVQPPLKQLLASVAGVATVVARGEPLPPFDHECPIMSLPLILGTELDSIPAEARYVSSDPARVCGWSERLGPRTLPRIGLAWSGSRTHTNDHNRSISLAELLAHLPHGFQYVGLQKELREADRQTLRASGRVIDTSEHLTDFSETAAVCECMDLVISVDTSVAHLSGALGRPTWLLLPFNPDWRWLLERSDTPWYPSMTLHRQRQLGSWREALQELAAALCARHPAGGTAG